MASPVEGIGAVGSSSSQGLGGNIPNLTSGVNPTDPAPSYQPRWVQALNTPNASHTYSCFLLMLLALSNLGMGNINGAALAQSNLMDTEQSLQKNLVTISSFLSQLQQNSTADSKGFQAEALPNGTTFSSTCNYLADPNAFNGLASTFYSMQSSGANFGAENPSAAYQTSMASFIQAFKEIFYCNTNQNAPTVSSLSEIYNPNVFQNGQGFNLTSFWQSTNQGFTNAGYNLPQYPQDQVISTNPSDTASLLQQYMFYKAQVTVDTGSIPTVDGANGDISQLVTFDPTKTGCDPFITQTLGLWNSLNTTESVNRSGLQAGAIAPCNATSGNLIDMMLTGNYGQLTDTGTPYAGDSQVGLYGAFSYMAFNDYWEKNPAGNTNQTVTAPTGGPSNWQAAQWKYNVEPDDRDGYVPAASWSWGSPIASLGNAQGDDLASLTTTVNGVQTNAGAATSNQSSAMQELTANQSSYVSIGQNLLQNLGQSLTQWSQNQLSS